AGEVREWGERLHEVRVAGFARRRTLAALPHVVYWFGWRDRDEPLDADVLGRRLVRAGATARKVGLLAPMLGVSHAISDWADLRRALTRATVGFRQAMLERRPF